MALSLIPGSGDAENNLTIYRNTAQTYKILTSGYKCFTSNQTKLLNLNFIVFILPAKDY